MHLKKILFSLFALLHMAMLYAQVPEMVWVEGGSFTMGSLSGEEEERPVRTVTLNNFSIGKYEVTVGEYKAFCTATGRKMPEPPRWDWNDKHPVVNVSWKDAVAYCNRLSKTTKKNFRLPTEAEWEYAARGGQKSSGYLYAGGKTMEEVGWYKDNSGRSTNPAGQKRPNEMGLYDMSGNVWEWCLDWYDKYPNQEQTNPRGPSRGKFRVMRGGSWYYSAVYARTAARFDGNPSERENDQGFRVVLSR